MDSFNRGRGVAANNAWSELRLPPGPSEAAASQPEPPRGAKMLVLDEAMVAACRLADRLARGAISILLFGETGVGKERFAERIHEASGRAGEPFVAVNCAAVNPNLFESELFGHERGAFTGAERSKPGWLEMAGGGTMFLDEVGELSLDCQAKLLRALEAKSVVPVGATSARPLRARFIAATNRDLTARVARGEFRDDLYYRLAGATLVIPPLRHRPKEILPIARAFAEAGAEPRRLSPDAERALLAHSWPGNIRELRNVIERAVLLAEGTVITAADLELGMAVVTRAPTVGPLPLRADPRAAIESALRATGGHREQTAALLGVSSATLYRHMARLGLSRRRGGLEPLPPAALDQARGGGPSAWPRGEATIERLFRTRARRFSHLADPRLS
jgi:transcriptional regulator with PAS, ATPase and Fis domain